MFRFSVDPLTRIQTAIDKLEQGLTPAITSFGVLNEKHGNTPLLCALAWNRLEAAAALLRMDSNKIALNIKDNWPTCRNTPLVLAAKINATAVIAQLLAAGAAVNTKDYRDFTALHYACLYRNEEAIKILLANGARLDMEDAFGKLPLQYYLREITTADLRYTYGRSLDNPAYLHHVPDFDDQFYATKTKCYSSLRWYIAHVIVNGKLGLDVQIDGRSLYDWASACLARREPVDHAHVYEAMLACFCAARPLAQDEITLCLTPPKNVYEDYLDSMNPAYLNNNLFALVPKTSMRRDKEGYSTIELQSLFVLKN